MTPPVPVTAPGESPGLLSLFTSLPLVSEALHAVTTCDIGPVTELLARAAYFPLLLSAESTRAGGAFQVVGEPRRFEIGTEAAAAGPLRGRNRVGGPAAGLRFRWRVVPDDYRGDPDRVPPLPPLPLAPHLAQRVEVFDWELRFASPDGRGESGFRAYGAGHTLPGAVGDGAGAGLAFVLDVRAGFGELAGLAGTVVAGGSLGPRGELELALVSRIMDPAGGLSAPPPPLQAAAAPAPAATYLGFLGEVDPQHPVTLRLSLTEGVLGSNVFELLRVADLDGGTGADGRPRGGAKAGVLAGSVSARLSFDPLSLCPISPIQTRSGVFAFHDAAGREIGSLASDMTEGRAFRTALPGRLLPVFRFGGFGRILGGSGEFAGARGIMTMNSVVSVQPRTLANLYLLRLDDPDGRYRAAAGGASGGWAG